ncbi:hypothetical protein CEXT_659221 [Caerostris extrusa]|uniref:Uncharacterized protein n=1 Tax=Caerostris extrusa TaxID=172846 RepID=A0AAV4V5M0_CAEEX|nr:hypothetical protein CEXT_659221 [Caerostris extrusa]
METPGRFYFLLLTTDIEDEWSNYHLLIRKCANIRESLINCFKITVENINSSQVSGSNIKIKELNILYEKMESCLKAATRCEEKSSEIEKKIEMHQHIAEYRVLLRRLRDHKKRIDTLRVKIRKMLGVIKKYRGKLLCSFNQTFVDALSCGLLRIRFIF